MPSIHCSTDVPGVTVVAMRAGPANILRSSSLPGAPSTCVRNRLVNVPGRASRVPSVRNPYARVVTGDAPRGVMPQPCSTSQAVPPR